MIPRNLNHVFWRPNPEFNKELCNYLQGKKVLEIFAGNGYLASVLNREKIPVKATTLFSGHDGHDYGMHYPVEEISAVGAVRLYAREADVLLICWPTTVRDVCYAAQLWGKDKEIIYIGEVTNLAKNELGGCATDEFFELMSWYHEFESYKGNYIEHALVGKVQ